MTSIYIPPIVNTSGVTVSQMQTYVTETLNTNLAHYLTLSGGTISGNLDVTQNLENDTLTANAIVKANSSKILTSSSVLSENGSILTANGIVAINNSSASGFSVNTTGGASTLFFVDTAGSGSVQSNVNMYINSVSTTAFQVNNGATSYVNVDTSTPVITIGCKFVPSGNNTCDLGSSSDYWNNCYLSNPRFNYVQASSGGAFGIGATLQANADNTYTCGTASFRWSTVYAVNGSINTSAENCKTNIQTLDPTLGLSFINALQPKSYKWVSEPDSHFQGDTHLGLIFEDVVSSASSIGWDGTTPEKSLFFIQEPHTEVDVTTGQIVTSNAGLSYQELFAPIVLAIQQLSAQVQTLQAQVTALHN